LDEEIDGQKISCWIDFSPIIISFTLFNASFSSPNTS